jgi:hypothetical protein
MFCNELEIGKQADVADVTDVEDSTTNPFHQLRKWPIILT